MNADDAQALRNLVGRVLARTSEPGTDKEAYELASAVQLLLDTLAMRTGQLMQARANAAKPTYPGLWAYDQACLALAKHREIADEATELLLQLGSWGLDRAKEEELLDEAWRLRNRFEAHLPASA